MILLKDWQSLDDVLKHLKIQVIDSMPFVNANVPKFSHPKNLFYWLKARTIYQNDPETTELLMTAQTLMKGNETGTPGAGDCDDFTILALAGLIRCGFRDNYVILTGRTRRQPSHIYVSTRYLNKIYIFDLTNDRFNYERPYPYKQQLKFAY